MILQTSVPLVETLYNESKFWIGLIAASWSLFNGVQWIKGIKTNDLPHIQAGVDSLKTEVKEQTNCIVSELRELRSDIRTFTAAVAASNTKARSSRRTPRRRTATR